MAGQPLPKHLNIVAVESNYCSIPPLSVPEGYTFTLTTYDRSTPEEVAERIRDADIAITIVAPFTAEALAETNSPRLRMIATISSGTDQVDLKACAARGIAVLNSPNCNTNTVAEHALATYFAVRRAFVPCMHKLNQNEWVRTGVLVKTMYTHGATQPPRTLSQEVVAIVGYGAVGKAVQARFEALGATVRIVARKGVVPTADSGRISFEQALAEATVLVLCCPRTAETEGLLGAKEFAAMRPDAVLVNMSRGRVVNEQALLDALRNREISGAGVDVFEVEPAGPENSVLVGRQDEGLNLVLSPHTAWSSLDTVENYQRVCQLNVLEFVQGRVNPERVVV
ncbi:Glyoxylate reductase [Ceratocystis lukuohia]|uniref:Glyoxylate reductase n=1 Tax=Ceratocystis lukuohia TaxID=2019550 RepID=A0ABR4MHK3_9PEZI